MITLLYNFQHSSHSYIDGYVAAQTILEYQTVYILNGRRARKVLFINPRENTPMAMRSLAQGITRNKEQNDLRMVLWTPANIHSEVNKPSCFGGMLTDPK